MEIYSSICKLNMMFIDSVVTNTENSLSLNRKVFKKGLEIGFVLTNVLFVANKLHYLIEQSEKHFIFINLSQSYIFY